MNVQSAITAGLLVQYVYDQWNSSGSATSLTGRPILNSHGAPLIAGKHYTVSQTIYANNLATDLFPRGGVTGWVTIGMVAVEAADPNDIVIALRGTVGIWEWIQDVKFLPRPFTRVAGGGLTDDGFTDMYDSFSLTPGAASGTFLTDLIATLPAPTTARVTIAGHSLGAALATLLALDMGSNSTVRLSLYTLASPRVGDLGFERLFNHVVPDAYRIVNRLDIVPKLPPPLFYFHVGDETELLPAPKELVYTLECEHMLVSYIHLLAKQLGSQAAFPLNASCIPTPTP